MSTAKNILFERHQDWVLLVHGADPPNDDEWARYADVLRDAANSSGRGLLALTDGVGPNALQRKQVSDVKMRGAIVTLSRVARGIVTALGWVGVEIKAFPPEDLEDALDYLEIDAQLRLPMRRRLAEMRLELAGEDPAPASTMTESALQELLGRSIANVSAS
ncbi:MAG: STAS/SEC14 domain-containing protein [Myxococcota bacterium]